MLYPLLVTDLADGAARDFLTGLALANRVAFLPLLSAPADAGIHRLEVYTPESVDPLVLFALPAGKPTVVGFPLRLSIDAATTNVARGSTDEPPPSASATLTPRRNTKVYLSDRHTRDLAGETVVRSAESLVGRPLAGGKLLLGGVIGTGGAGIVYKARHRDLRIAVAVKVLHESFQANIDFCRRFHAEALAASRLDHVNVVRVLDFGQEPDGLLYLAMEHLEGTPLSQILEGRGPQPLARIVEIMTQVAAAVGHAHARGIVHRDVKPDNILLVPVADDDGATRERVKVCDFGIAVEQHDAADALVVAGTPAYMSPEQCRGEALDGRSDVYACGVILYELATGRLPFEDESPSVLLNQHIQATPPAPSTVFPDIDRRLEDLIMRALAKAPDARPKDMRSLRVELASLIGDEPPVASDPTPSPTSHVSVPSLAPAPLRRPGGAASARMSSADWLEHGSDVHARTAATADADTPVHGPDATLGPWLARFAETPNGREFNELAAELEVVLADFADRGDARGLFAIHSTLEMIRTTAAGLTAGVQRAARVRTLSTAFTAPALLARLAEAALGAEDRYAARLLARIGTPAAYALYSARLKQGDDSRVRARFIEIVQQMGVTALPMIRAGLARLATHHTQPVAQAMAIDLLLATPDAADEETGELAARWIRVGAIEVMRAAISALAKTWGERARPIFAAAAKTSDQELATTARTALAALDVRATG